MPDAAASSPSPTLTDAPARPYVLFEDGQAAGQVQLFDEPEELIVAPRAGGGPGGFRAHGGRLAPRTLSRRLCGL